MSSTKLTTDNMRTLDASKLSGALPSLDGSNLTHLGDVEVSDGDPLPISNKSLGQIWMNHSSGESYMCTDATVGSNVWTNIGASGTGDIFKPPFSYQGTHGGYVVGGAPSYGGSGPDINHFLFSSSTQQADHNSLIYSVGTNVKCTKDTANGWVYAKGGPGYSSTSVAMQRFSLTSGVNTQAVCNLTGGESVQPCEFSTSSHGYYVGGSVVSGQADFRSGDARTSHSDRFAFASSVSRQNWGGLQSCFVSAGACQDGENYGYCIGNIEVYAPYGQTSARGKYNQKVNLQSSATATYITDAQYHQLRQGACSSTTHGYTHGGHWYNGPAGGPITNQVSRFQFSTGSAHIEVGNLDKSRHDPVGLSSVSYGYSAGGIGGSMPPAVDIDRYAYSSSVSTSDWGTLSGGNCQGGSAEN